MKTRAKLVCTGVEPNVSGEVDTAVKHGEQVSFCSQYNTEDSAEDNSFSAATPSASFGMFVSNPELYGAFEVGKAYYFDITACD